MTESEAALDMSKGTKEWQKLVDASGRSAVKAMEDAYEKHIEDLINKNVILPEGYTPNKW